MEERLAGLVQLSLVNFVMELETFFYTGFPYKNSSISNLSIC
jgi:hypothetical protein